MEALQKATGGCGRFQWMMVASIKLGLMPIAWSMFQMTFGGMVPDWWCLPSTPDHHGNVSSSSNGYRGNWSRDNVTYQACGIPGSGGESCASHVVFDDSVNTVISEWSLVCERKYVKAMLTSLQMAGVFIGAVVAGQSSDAIGRRKTCYAALTWHLVTSLVAAFSVNWQMFLAMRILIGVSLGAYLVASFPYCFEFVGARHRQAVAFTPGWNTGASVFALGAWLLRDWSHLHIASALLTIPILLTWFIVPESARWLATKGRLQEAERVVQYVARVNRRPLPNNTLLTLQHVALEEQRVGQGRRYTYLDVYRGCRMAVTSLILSVLWFSMSFSYYGISFGISALTGNVYLNIFLMNIIEIPFKLVIVFIADRLGRRLTCTSLYTLCALTSFAILVVEKTVSESHQGSVTTVLATSSKVCIGSVWMTAATFTSELYPTVVRGLALGAMRIVKLLLFAQSLSNSLHLPPQVQSKPRNLGYGACSMAARVGGALAPLLLNMDTAEDVVRAYVIVGSVMAVSAILTLFLRETKGQGLQDSITIYAGGRKPNKVKADGENDGPPQQKELQVWTEKEEENMDEEKRETIQDMIQEENEENGGKEEDKGKGEKESKVEILHSNGSEIFTVRL